MISKIPYRVLGVLSNCTKREIKKNVSKLKAFSQLGRNVDFALDFNLLLGEITREQDDIIQAENNLNLDKDKILYSLWYSDIAPYDGVIISKMINCDFAGACKDWEKAINSKGINNSNYSAFNNLSTLLMHLSIDPKNSNV